LQSKKYFVSKMYDVSFFSIVHPPPSIAPPPPLGYPTKQENPQNLAGETKSKGGGFWKGW
jgi:hypothetical protein